MSEELDTDLDEAERFLRWAHPAGPWVLTSIPVEGGKTTTETFFDMGAVRGWVGNVSGKQNVYFTVNRIRGAMDVKPKKEHVEEAVMLHIDIDPKKPRDGMSEAELDKWNASEQARILKLLEDFSPSPSAVTFSGGGYQGFWMLDEPLYIGGDANRISELEAYNKQLGIVLGGDNTWNIDRIMRLPGTINLPDEKKRKKGRRSALARIVELSEATHPLMDFTPAAEVQSDSSGSGCSAAVELPNDIPPADLDALPAAVSAETRALIANGSEAYPSRSEILWRVINDLIRAGCDDSTIAAVALDRRYALFEHIRDQKGDKRAYLVRQIGRARQDAPAGGRMVLDPDDPYATAHRMRDKLYPHMLRTNGDFLGWRAGAYHDVEDATIESDAWRELSAAVVRKKQDDAFVYVPFKPKPGNVEGYLKALRGLVHVPVDQAAPPAWLDGDGPPPLEMVALRNGLLHVPSGVLSSSTPRFFTRNALEIDFNPDAPPPLEWLRFVEQIFPDPAAAALLQDWFGYLLLPDVSQQKIMLLVGPPRSGKGVIQHVITALVGAGNVCSPSGNDLGGSNVGALQPLIGSTVAFLPDARFGGRTDKVAITANLLAMSAGDRMTISRKFKAAWSGVLAARLVIMTNELPGLRDNSSALANRFTPLILEQSFLGKEDVGLASRIIANELPGVLLWALDGWRRLRERGHFALPTASEEAIAEILDLGSPVAAFVNARCHLSEGKSVEKERLYSAYRAWCEATQQRAVADNVFSRDLKTATGGKVKPTKTRMGASGGGKLPVFVGIELRDESGPEHWQPGPEPGPASLPFGDDARWEPEPY